MPAHAVNLACALPGLRQGSTPGVGGDPKVILIGQKNVVTDECTNIWTDRLDGKNSDFD